MNLSCTSKKSHHLNTSELPIQQGRHSKMSEYSVSGELRIGFRDENLVAFILDMPNYERKNKFLYFLDEEDFAQVEATKLIQRILEEWNFYFVLTKHKSVQNNAILDSENYTTIYFGVSNDIQVHHLGSFLTFLAGLGFDIEGNFEDNKGKWGYDSLSYDPKSGKGLVVEL